MKLLNKCGNLAFIHIKVNAGPFAELVYQVEKDDHDVHRDGADRSVIIVPFAGEL